MNRVYFRLLTANILLILITILNCVFPFLNSYTIILFLLLFLMFSYYYIGYEKNNKRYQKDILIKIITYSIAYYIITYLTGLLIGFNKTGYSLDYLSIIKHVLPVILTIPLLELIRYIFITKGIAYKSIIVLSVIALILLDITLLITTYSYGVLNFFLLVLIPSIGKNILFTYLSTKVGYKIPITFRLMFETTPYILPIFPALGVYIESLLGFLFPMLIIYLVNYNFMKTEKEKIVAKPQKKLLKKVLIGLTIFIMITIITLTTGALKYFAVTIGSNSMVPRINKGDIVIVERLNEREINDLKVRDILVFRHNNIIIVHRIIRIMEVNGEKYFYTKGDNNNGEDGYPIRTTDIIGTYFINIPYIGYITVQINEMFNE